MNRFLMLALVFVASFSAKAEQNFDCPLVSWHESRLDLFLANGFSDQQASYDELSVSLIDCLSHPDKRIRDEITYSALSTWLRKEQLSSEATIDLYVRLYRDISQRRNDANQVYLPFTILTFAEVMRVDRIKPYLSEQQLNQTVDLVADTMTKIDDYRGFDNQIGWRHMTAHTADVMLQLILNKRLTAKQHDLLVNALIVQISPNDHSYTFGESKRLLTPILYSWMSEKPSIEQWQSYLDRIVDPSPLTSWQQAYQSELGLHKLHNTRLFLLELYRVIAFNNAERLNVLEKSVKLAIKALP